MLVKKLMAIWDDALIYFLFELNVFEFSIPSYDQEADSNVSGALTDIRKPHERQSPDLSPMCAKRIIRDIGETSKSVYPDRREQLHNRLLEHLEAAQAITDELGLDDGGNLVERALDKARFVSWAHADPNIELFRRSRS